MKFIFTFFILVLITTSCTKENLPGPDAHSSTFDDPNWLKIELPGEREAHSVYGDINDTLLVSTHMYIFMTVDQGKTWTKTASFHSKTYNFLSAKDSLFALTAHFLTDEYGYPLASYADEFSVDNGESWEYTGKYNISKDRKMKYAFAKSNGGTIYRLSENIELFEGSETDGYVLKRTLLKGDAGSLSPVQLPFDNQLTNLYIDKHNRLYITATAAIHDEKSGKYVRNEDGNPAIIYISKESADKLSFP